MYAENIRTDDIPHSRCQLSRQIPKRNVMSSSLNASATPFVSRYEQRVILVRDVMRKNSTLDEKTAHELAVHVVYAIDHIPEPKRH